jgi:8-oxo-dGDP phosphatase
MEETGLDFEPTTLLMVESATGSWFRFVMTGNVIGGRLKTTSEADAESLQARWVKDVTEIPLRAKDILPLIERGKYFIV